MAVRPPRTPITGWRPFIQLRRRPDFARSAEMWALFPLRMFAASIHAVGKAAQPPYEERSLAGRH